MKHTLYRLMPLLAMFPMGVMAQSGTNSPYSQYGLGVLSEQSSGFNRGMNGLGIAFQEHNQINYLNPASYASLDSLTFIFDMGMSGQITNFQENGVKKNAKNADFEYAVAGFRAFKHVGLSFGVIPFTNVGYNYSSTAKVGGDNSTTYTNTYSGSGGIHQVYVGAGWEPLKGFSVGANLSYLWGNYTHAVANSYSDATVSTLTKVYSASINSYRLDLGAQYTAHLDKKRLLTVGANFTRKHDIGGHPQCVVNSDTLPKAGDSPLSLSIPTMYGIGISYCQDTKLKVGADYSVQKWGALDYPYLKEVNGEQKYVMTSGIYKDRRKFTIGGEYCHRERSSKFLDRVRYRFGASYATPYYYINGNDGPRELSVSLGFGIPIINTYNNRSVLNVSGQWVQTSAKDLIKENTFRINIGLTFNERWFMKWKVE